MLLQTHRLNEEFHLKGGATPPPPPPFSPPPPSPQAVTATTDISRSSKSSRNAGDNNLSRQNSQHSILQTLKSPSPHQEAVISELKHLTISLRGAPDNQYVKAQPFTQPRSPTLYQPQSPHASAPLLDNNYYRSPTDPPQRRFSHPPASGDAAAPSFEQHYQKPTGPPRRIFSHPPTSGNGAASLLDQHYQRLTGTVQPHPSSSENNANICSASGRVKTRLSSSPDLIRPDFQDQPRRASLYHSLSVDHAYEQHLSNNIYRNAPDQSRPRLQRHSLPFTRQDLPTNRRMSEDELNRLLLWRSSVKGTAHISNQEMDVREISIEAQRVRLAMSLFDALLVSREQMFLDSIDELNNMADKLGGGQKKMKAAGIAGGTVGGVGVAATVAGVALAPCTMGLSLFLTAAGVGMVADGGAGGALAVKSKTANTQRKKKVEEIVQDYKSNMADVEDCLGFIALGMERLSRIHPNVVQQLDEETYTMHRLALELRDQRANLRLSRRSSSLSASGMDILVSKSDKNSEAARKIREQAEQMESGLGELIGIRDKINYVDTVHMLY